MKAVGLARAGFKASALRSAWKKTMPVATDSVAGKHVRSRPTHAAPAACVAACPIMAWGSPGELHKCRKGTARCKMITGDMHVRA